MLAIGEPGGWTAGVRWVQIAGHTYHRFHVAVIDPNGLAAYTTFATMISEAEGNVYGRNLKRNACCRSNPGLAAIS